MTILIVTVAITLFLGLALVFLMASGPSAVANRLVHVAGSRQEVVQQQQPATGVSSIVTGISAIIGPIRRLLGFSENPDLVRRLALAGYKDSKYVEMFYAVRLLAPVVAALLTGFVITGNLFFWFLIITVAGFLAPDFWLSGAISRRRTRIRLSLPDALDLLVICMEAGLGLDQALIRVGQELKISHPDLSEEFMIINMEQRAGKPRLEAWRNMADRTQLDTVKSFVNMLVQTERFGTPISRSLNAFSDSLRTKRRQQAEELAAKTTIKMLFPLVLFIFPSMFVVLLAPAIISITRNLGKFFQ